MPGDGRRGRIGRAWSIVVGAAGRSEYAAQFRQAADRWQAACEKAGAESIAIGLSEQTGADRS